jgi:hypothetical protein
MPAVMDEWVHDDGTKEDIFLNDPRHREYNDVYIGQSKFGMGLFAKRRFENKEHICQYWGEVVPTDVAEQDDYESAYVFRLNARWSVDGAYDQSCYARYINDPIRKKKNNAYFAISTNPRKAMGRGKPGLVVMASKVINPGDEIMAHYDNHYWAGPNFLNLGLFNRRVMYERSQEVRQWVNPRLDEIELPPSTHLQDDDVPSDEELQPE